MNEGILGEIRLFGGNFAPRNWALCDGRLIPINENQALFSILGIQYGGDGKTNFAIPKLDSPPVAGDGATAAPLYIICLYGIYPSRS